MDIEIVEKRRIDEEIDREREEIGWRGRNRLINKVKEIKSKSNEEIKRNNEELDGKKIKEELGKGKESKEKKMILKVDMKEEEIIKKKVIGEVIVGNI